MTKHKSASLPFLEAVAKLRYALAVMAELLYFQKAAVMTAEQGEEHHYFAHDALQLMDGTKTCCSNPHLNQIEAGPAVFLVKLLVRQYGFSFLATLTTDPSLTWVVPTEFRQSKVLSAILLSCIFSSSWPFSLLQEEKHVDMFVIYNPVYSRLRSSLTNAVYWEQLEKLSLECKVRLRNVGMGINSSVCFYEGIVHNTSLQTRHTRTALISLYYHW